MKVFKYILEFILRNTPEYDNCYYKDECCDNCVHSDGRCWYHLIDKLIERMGC